MWVVVVGERWTPEMLPLVVVVVVVVVETWRLAVVMVMVMGMFCIQSLLARFLLLPG